MRIRPVKCDIMQITRKLIRKNNASFSFEGAVLDNGENIKYIGIERIADLKE